VNAKSLLGILSMGLTKDSEMTILAEGKDEQEAVMALIELAGESIGE